MKTFTSINPATGEIVGAHPINTEKEINAMVSDAAQASKQWVALDSHGRKKVLLNWAALLTAQMDLGADLIHRETGKPLSDAKLEISLAIGHIAWAAKHAGKILYRQYRPAGLLMFNMAARVERSPYGVVGVIGPWNYPVFTPIGSITYALAAGNTVVFKPSEFTPGVGLWLSETFSQVAPFPAILTTATGGGETGVALTQSAVHKISFTGSTRTAKKVAASCAANMIPVILECGGKDGVIINKDANLKKAAEITLWHALSNAGQSCIGAERVYVHADVAVEFKKLIVEMAKDIRSGYDDGANYGPATIPAQIKVIKSHIKDASDKGGIFLLGSENAIHGAYVEPVILSDVPEDSLAMQEETFGPTLVINTVSSMEEAIRLTNATRYGLGAAVWSNRKGHQIASQLRCGMVSINSAFLFAAVSSLPFGGVGDSGYGRIHGAEGLLEYVYTRTVVKPRFSIPLSLTTFNRNKFADTIVAKMIFLLYGKPFGKKKKI